MKGGTARVSETKTEGGEAQGSGDAAIAKQAETEKR